MIIQLPSCSRKSLPLLDVFAFTGDFARFSLLHSEADAPDAPAFLAAELFGRLAHHSEKRVRQCELALWADAGPLDARKWMFYATSERISDDLLAALKELLRGFNGWYPVGSVPMLSPDAVPLYEYKNGVRYLLLSDVLVGGTEEEMAHPFVKRGGNGLNMGFGVFPEGYLNENKLYLGRGGGISFKTKWGGELRPGKVYSLVSNEEASGNNADKLSGANAPLRLV
jgi:hypothetical protein